MASTDQKMGGSMVVTVYRCEEEHRSRGCGAVGMYDADLTVKRRKCPNCGKVACWLPIGTSMLVLNSADPEPTE